MVETCRCGVAQLASSIPLPLPDLPPLYIAGDSHSLAPAWRTVSYLGRPHLLRPALATGCKIWHLRKESDFFPRANFESMIASIPPGSPVVFCFGEIDCREGLLVAIERCRYETLQQGVEATIKIYLEKLRQVGAATPGPTSRTAAGRPTSHPRWTPPALTRPVPRAMPGAHAPRAPRHAQLCAERRYKIFVHPVPPVLNETRHIVKTFNAALQAALATSSQLTYLDFFDSMLSADGEQLKDGLQASGPHCLPHPLPPSPTATPTATLTATLTAAAARRHPPAPRLRQSDGGRAAAVVRPPQS